MRRVKALILTFSLLQTACLVAQAPTDQQPVTQDSLRKGSEAFRAGKFDEAEKAFWAAVQANPQDSTALM